MTANRITILIVFLGVSLLFLAFWVRGDRAETSVDTETQSTRVKWVKVSPVKALPPKGSIEYVGVLNAQRKVSLASEIGGTIERLYFEKGDRVADGQLLAEISTSSLRLEIQMANAALKETKAALSEAENSYRRTRNLYEIHAVSDSEFDSAKRSAKMARANMEKAEAALGLAEDRLRKSMVHAPCAGIMAFRNVEEGEVIPPGTTISQVIDLERLKIKVSLGEKDIQILQKHKNFVFTVDAIPNETFSCQLSFLSPTANPVTRSFPLELTVEEPDRRMADGMTVRVIFPLVNEKKTIKVPSAWLSEENGSIGLFMVKDAKALFRKVTLGAYYDQRVEILSGLSGQELVITNPTGLKSGDLVEY
jgi:RND family efflux transporter MFP subunit